MAGESSGWGSFDFIGYSGDGGPADAAELFYPRDVTVDGSGNIYIVRLASLRVAKL